MKHKVVIIFAFSTHKKCLESFKSFVEENAEKIDMLHSKDMSITIGSTTYLFSSFSGEDDFDKVCGLELSAVIFEDDLDIQLERYLLSRVRLRSFK